MKKILFIIPILFSLSNYNIFAVDGFFIGGKTELLLKIDIAGSLKSKRVIDPQMNIANSINTGIGQYGNADSHGFPRVIEAQAAPYFNQIFNWGYKFPKVFTLGFGFMLSNFLMPSLMFDFKFTVSDTHIVKPYTILSIYSGLFDGFPIGITTGGGIDIYLTKSFYLLIESRFGAELFIAKYYDDGINSHPIWHWETFYAYGVATVDIGFGLIIKNKYTDENGKWIGVNKN